MERLSDPRQSNVTDGHIRGGYCLEMVVGRKLPRDVVVRRRSILRVVLRCEQINRVVSVWLIEANHVRSRRKPSFLDLNCVLRPANFDVLPNEPCHHLFHSGRISLISRNQKRIGRLSETFLPGIPRLLVEIAQPFFGMLGCIVERCKGASLLVVEIVARRPGNFSRRWKRTVPLHTACGW